MMRLIFAALCALGLSAASFSLLYDVRAITDSQMREPAFQLAAGMVLVAFWVLIESLLVKRQPKQIEAPKAPTPVVVDETAQKKAMEEVASLRTLVNERESQRKVLESALRDVEGRLAAEQEKKAQGATSVEVEAQVVQFLSQLQERGRFVDFLMQDVQTFGDEQVGRAARVVHQGCRAVLQEMCTLTPVTSDPEGQTVNVEAGEAQRFRLVGSVSGTPPYRGRLLHRGWRTGKVNLPARVENRSGPESTAGYVVVPAEVELSA